MAGELSSPRNSMNINQLYSDAKSGGEVAEKRLFDYLAVSFRAFVRLKNVSKDDSEDIVQAALLRIVEKYRHVGIHSTFAGWAHEVLKNTLIDHFRGMKMERRKNAEFASGQGGPHANVPNPRLRAELGRCLQAIHKRNSSYARILHLHIQGYSTPEICDKEGITSGNLYVILSRARAALRECLISKGVLGD